MKILVINSYAGSPRMGMVFRHYYLAQEWIKKSHDVLLIAGSYSHLRRQNPKVQKNMEVTEEEGVHYLWMSNKPYEGNGVGRAKNMFSFTLNLYKNAGKIVKIFKPDIVLASCTNPLDTYAAQKISRIAHAPLIHEVRDLWPITLMELYGVKASNPLAVAMQIGENSMCKHSDYLTSVLPESEKHFLEHGLKKGRFRFIPNGIVESEWENTPKLPDGYRKVFDDLHKEGKFILCFFGSHTRSYSLSELIEAVAAMPDDRVAVVFVGKGNYKEQLKEQAARTGKDCFVFLDPVEKQYIPDLLEHADALYVGGIRNSIFRFGIAMNKLFDSMMSGKPILYAVEAPNNYIEEYSCGISVEAENVEALKTGLTRMMQMSTAELEAMGANGKTAVLKNFTYSVIAKKYICLFHDAIKQKKN